MGSFRLSLNITRYEPISIRLNLTCVCFPLILRDVSIVMLSLCSVSFVHPPLPPPQTPPRAQRARGRATATKRRAETAKKRTEEVAEEPRPAGRGASAWSTGSAGPSTAPPPPPPPPPPRPPPPPPPRAAGGAGRPAAGWLTSWRNTSTSPPTTTATTITTTTTGTTTRQVRGSKVEHRLRVDTLNQLRQRKFIYGTIQTRRHVLKCFTQTWIAKESDSSAQQRFKQKCSTLSVKVWISIVKSDQVIKFYLALVKFFYTTNIVKYLI